MYSEVRPHLRFTTSGLAVTLTFELFYNSGPVGDKDELVRC